MLCRTMDIFDPDTYVNGPPHQAFAELRHTDPVHWQEMAGDPRGGCWAVLRHADVTYVAKHPHAAGGLAVARGGDERHLVGARLAVPGVELGDGIGAELVLE